MEISLIVVDDCNDNVDVDDADDDVDNQQGGLFPG